MTMVMTTKAKEAMEKAALAVKMMTTTVTEKRNTKQGQGVRTNEYRRVCSARCGHLH